MKQTVIILSLVILGITSRAQGIYNDGARIVSETGTSWVIDGGGFTLTSQSADYPATMANLAVKSGASLTIGAGNYLSVTGTLTNSNSASGIVIRSDASGDGALINGTSGVSATVERWITGDIWHLISPPATGLSISAFTGASGNSIGYNSSSSHYALAPYVVSTDTWSYYTYPTPTGTFDTPGKGYQILRGTSSSTGNGNVAYDGVVTFTGTLGATNLGIGITQSGATYGWNLIGNPYPCGLDVKAFLDANTTAGSPRTSSVLDNAYIGIYVSDIGDKSAYGYTAINYSNVGTIKLASGEGFFVKSKSGGGTVSFTTGMKSAGSDAFKSAVINFPTINLSAESATDKRNTTVNYISGMNNGLDPGYDAGLFNGGGPGSFSLSTRLVQDNGVDFQIQCLPDNDYGNMVIPVGLVAASGSAVTFKAAVTNLPADLKVVLEDRVANTFTRLDDGSAYTVTLNTASAGPGRFFLRTATIVSAVPGDLSVDLKVVALPNQHIIQVFGYVNLPARALVYDMNGKLMTSKVLTGIDLNEIPLVNAANGLYLLKIESNKTPVTQKVRWIRN